MSVLLRRPFSVLFTFAAIGGLSLTTSSQAQFVPDPTQPSITLASQRGTTKWKFPFNFDRRAVRYRTREKPGTIIIETRKYKLYYVLGNGRAYQYGVGIGRRGFGWKGTVRIGHKKEWPSWHPPAAMIKRDPLAAKWAHGMPGGINNPLGARALYLYSGGRDTLYRIHGTNQPSTIGRSMSSGCIRLKNEDIKHLYRHARVGAKVIVR